jgi:hypothetical protein
VRAPIRGGDAVHTVPTQQSIKRTGPHLSGMSGVRIGIEGIGSEAHHNLKTQPAASTSLKRIRSHGHLVTRIYSVLSRQSFLPLVPSSPFFAPHQTISSEQDFSDLFLCRHHGWQVIPADLIPDPCTGSFPLLPGFLFLSLGAGRHTSQTRSTDESDTVTAHKLWLCKRIPRCNPFNPDLLE